MSILFLVFIGLVAVQSNSVRAVDDEGSFEEGNVFVSLTLASYCHFQQFSFGSSSCSFSPSSESRSLRKSPFRQKSVLKSRIAQKAKSMEMSTSISGKRTSTDDKSQLSLLSNIC